MAVMKRGSKFVVRWREGNQFRGRTFSTLKEANEFQGTVLSTSPTERSRRRTNLEFADFAYVWLGHLRHEGYAEATVRRYQVELDYVIVPWARRHRWKIADVYPAQLRDLIADREKAGVKPGTRAKAVTVLRAAFRDAVLLDFRSENPALTLRARAPQGQTRDKIPDIEHIRAVAAACRRPLVREWLLTMAFTGARPSEALGLQWEHIDRDGRTIEIGLTPVVETGGNRFVKDGAKTAAGTGRVVPLLREMDRVLDELAKLKKEGQPWLFPGRQTSKSTASSVGTLPMSHEHARRCMKQDCIKAKLAPSTRTSPGICMPRCCWSPVPATFRS